VNRELFERSLPDFLDVALIWVILGDVALGPGIGPGQVEALKPALQATRAPGAGVASGATGYRNIDERGKTMTEGNQAGAPPMQGGPLSRKRFLTGSAALVGGGALAAALPRMAQAHDTGKPSDVDMLNYALTLEHLEYAFYRDGLMKFDEQDFRSSNLFKGSGNLLRPTVYENFRLIREHEDTHVETLKFVISEVLGGIPVPEAEYNFEQTAFTSVEKFVSVAKFLENTGVTAYDGAIAHIQRAKLLTAGATIATVEARHAAYLNLLNDTSPFPDAFDTPVAPQAICKAVKAENGGFIVSAETPYGPYRSLDALCRKLPEKTITL